MTYVLKLVSMLGHQNKNEEGVEGATCSLPIVKH